MVNNWFRWNKSWLIFVGLILVFSCRRNDHPPGTLSHEQMVKVLGEIYIAEEKVRRLNISADSGKVVMDDMKNRVFDSLSVSDSIVKKSIDYYWDHPKEMDAIYAALVDSLNLREQKLSLEGP